VKGSRKIGSQKSEVKSIKFELKELKEKDLFRKLACIESSHGPKISINGQTYVNFSSNDYLNLSGHRDIVKAASSALKKYGFGSGSSRLLSGTYPAHKRLEDRITEFKGTQAALVFNTGYAANTGTIPALSGDGSVIFSDELNHASIVDGARLAKAGVKVYRHKDVDHLESLLIKSSKTKTVKRKLIVTDTVFSMDGDLARLNDLSLLSRKYGAMLMTDDAHGTGVLGKTGRGALEHLAVKSDDIIQMGTLSKAFGCFGAFVTGKKDLIDLLINRARSFVYSTSLPPAVAEASVMAIDIIDRRSVRLRARLWKNRQRLFEGLDRLGFDTLGSETQIVPALIEDAGTALKVSKYLYRNKIFAPAIRPPTVPEGECRIRFSVTAGHTDDDIDSVLECLSRIK
jgi:glycine C-acetyltransferase